MGKVHRIKKHFWRIVSEEPLPVGSHYLAHTAASIYIGRVLRNGSPFVMTFSSDHAYNGLLTQLIKEYEGKRG